jgi:hypothetical protein
MVELHDREVTLVTDTSLCCHQATLAFTLDPFVQVTESNIVSGTDCIDFDKIICGSIHSDLIGVVTFSGDQYWLWILGSDLAVKSQFDLPASAEAIALNSTLVAISSWAEDSVFIYNEESLIRTIRSIKAVSLSFTGTFIAVLCSRDRCLFYSLEDLDDIHCLYCEGLHHSIIACEAGGLLLSGERPVLVQDLALKGFEYQGFTKGASRGAELALVCGDRLAVVRGTGFSMVVRDDQTLLNVLDAMLIPDSAKFIVVTEQGGRTNLGIADHPTSRPRHVVSVRPGEYVGIALIIFERMTIAAVVLATHLVVYEFCDDLLQMRSEVTLPSTPIAIESFGQRFIVAYPETFTLYQPDIISASDVKLKKVTDTPTLGASSCITCSDEIVAVTDELQSMVLYSFDESTHTFAEVARNTVDVGMSICRMRGDDYFCVDGTGNLYQMVIGETKNLESNDLVIMSCCNLGRPVKAMTVLQARLIIGTDVGQYIEILSFDRSPEFEQLYEAIEG